jgi:hypothetical protein
LHESDRAQPTDEMVELTPARQAEHRHRLLQTTHRDPGFAPCRILRRLEHDGEKKNQDTA